jgi:PAS domain S-box-containing protein
MLWITEPEGQCAFLSRSWYEYTGQTPETGLGFGRTLAVHPEDRDRTAAVFTAASERHEPFRVEYRLRRADGDYRWAIDAARPRVDATGAFLGYIGAVIDITERKTAETALEQEVEVRTTLAQVGATLAGELNPDRLVQAVTDAGTKLTSAAFGAFFHSADEETKEYALYTLSGAPKEAFASFPRPGPTSLFGPTFRGEGIIRIADVTKDPRYGRNPPRHGMPDGHLPVRSYLAVPVVARGGEVVGGLFFGHPQPDVFTAQHEQYAAGVASWAAIALDNARLYRDLEQANRLKDEFLATLSHELRTPLNAVLGWAHMLRTAPMKPSVQQRALESLERNARAQAQLVEDLLDVSRIMSGKLHIRAEPVDLGTIVANAVDMVRPGAAAKRIALGADVRADERTLVTGDADRLQQIVWNLVSNAIKFTPGGGRVHVELRRSDAVAEIVVSDTGQGIAPAFRPHLFERFRQSDASPARRHGGLGLGLSIVRHLTEAHGGTVAAESAGEGHGATFRVRLPILAIEARETLAAAAPGLGPSLVLAGLRALIVDDEPDARDLIRYVLESRGAAVVAAATTAEALRLLGHDAFDVLIADIGMPGQDGYSLIRVLRESSNEGTRTLPAVAVTASASARERELALEAGYDWHLAKPVDPDHLIATVSAVTAGESDRSGARLRVRTLPPPALE